MSVEQAKREFIEMYMAQTPKRKRVIAEKVRQAAADLESGKWPFTTSEGELAAQAVSEHERARYHREARELMKHKSPMQRARIRQWAQTELERIALERRAQIQLV